MILIVASGVNPDIPGGFDRNRHPKDKIVIPNDNFGIKEQVTKVVKVGLRSGIRGRDSSEKPTAKGGF